jgi:glycosyltransferase 2 family protein
MLKRVLPLLRAVVSLSLLVVLFSRVSAADLAARAQAGAFAPLAAALMLVLLMYLLVSLRWRAVARCFGLALSAPLALRAVFLGLFAGQVLPATVGNDVVRGSVMARHTGSIRRVAASVLADRLVALFAACLLLAAVHLGLGGVQLPFSALVVPAAIVASGAALAAFLFFGSAQPAAQAKPVLAAIALALIIHALGVLVAALTAAAYGADASLGVWFPVIVVSLIACAVPVSINGWGVREAVIVALAAPHGIPEPDALVVSLTLGVLNIAASLPGAYLLLRDAP